MTKNIMLIIWALITLTSTGLFAQPSDSQIRTDLTHPGVLSVKLSNTNGGKVWSTTDLQYYWERGAIVTRSAKLAEYPNATVEIGGIARYTIVGGKFSYKKFLVTWNEYKGIPTPTDDEVLQMVRGNLRQFVQGIYHSIVSQVEDIRIAEDKRSEWHTPNSFSINIACRYERTISYTETGTYDAVYRVRFYRDAISDPWKPNFISSRETENEIAKTTYDADEIRTMPTLASIDAEQEANAAMANLPTVEIPHFERDVDVFLFVHKMLREGTADEFEAMMMKMMAPSFFVEGSDILLTQRGADIINKNRKKAYEGKSTYANQYCADPAIKHRQENMIEFLNKSKQVHTRIAVGKFGGRFERGVRVDQKYKITALEVYLLTRPVDLEYMNSFPEDELCPATVQTNPQTAPSVAATRSEPEIQWQEHRSQSAGVSLAFPGQAEEQATAAQTGGTQYVIKSKHPSGVYQLTILPLPRKFNSAEKAQVINSMAANFISANQATKKSEKDYGNASATGKEYSLVRPQSGVVKYRIFATDSHLYQLVLSTTEEAFAEENETQFFGSFRIL